MRFKHFSKDETVGSGELIFRRYYENTNLSRFAQFVEGTIRELTPEDFGNITVLDEFSIVDMSKLQRIEMPDTITTIKYDAIVYCPQLKEIVFSANINTIQSCCFGGLTGNDYGNLVADFSKATQVPTIDNSTNPFDNNAFDNPFRANYITTIKVPTNLLSAWAESWTDDIARQKLVGV